MTKTDIAVKLAKRFGIVFPCLEKDDLQTDKQGNSKPAKASYNEVGDWNKKLSDKKLEDLTKKYPNCLLAYKPGTFFRPMVGIDMDTGELKSFLQTLKTYGKKPAGVFRSNKKGRWHVLFYCHPDADIELYARNRNWSLGGCSGETRCLKGYLIGWRLKELVEFCENPPEITDENTMTGELWRDLTTKEKTDTSGKYPWDGGGGSKTKEWEKYPWGSLNTEPVPDGYRNGFFQFATMRWGDDPESIEILKEKAENSFIEGDQSFTMETVERYLEGAEEKRKEQAENNYDLWSPYETAERMGKTLGDDIAYVTGPGEPYFLLWSDGRWIPDDLKHTRTESLLSRFCRDEAVRMLPRVVEKRNEDGKITSRKTPRPDYLKGMVKLMPSLRRQLEHSIFGNQFPDSKIRSCRETDLNRTDDYIVFRNCAVHIGTLDVVERNSVKDMMNTVVLSYDYDPDQMTNEVEKLVKGKKEILSVIRANLFGYEAEYLVWIKSDTMYGKSSFFAAVSGCLEDYAVVVKPAFLSASSDDETPTPSLLKQRFKRIGVVSDMKGSPTIEGVRYIIRSFGGVSARTLQKDLYEFLYTSTPFILANSWPDERSGVTKLPEIENRYRFMRFPKYQKENHLNEDQMREIRTKAEHKQSLINAILGAPLLSDSMLFPEDETIKTELRYTSFNQFLPIYDSWTIEPSEDNVRITEFWKEVEKKNLVAEKEFKKFRAGFRKYLELRGYTTGTKQYNEVKITVPN